MLLRPVLTQLAAKERHKTADRSTFKPLSDPILAGMTLQCSRMCVEAAIELLQLIHGTYNSHTTGAWWWDVLCKFSFPDHDCVKLTRRRRFDRRNSSYHRQNLPVPPSFAQPVADGSVMGRVPGHTQMRRLIQHLRPAVAQTPANHLHQGLSQTASYVYHASRTFQG